MTRGQAKQNLIALGIAEPTEDAITNYLNQVGGETKKEKERADGYKIDADRAADLQKQLDDIANKDKSDLEKLQAQYDALVKKDALNTARATAAEKLHLTAEQASKYVKDDGSYDFDLLGQIISERETAAATAKEQEIAKAQGNPGGGSAGGDNKGAEKSSAEKAAESVGKNMAASAKASADVLSSYIS